eukprot:gene20351-biopygen11280
MQFAVGAQRAAAVGHAIADLELSDFAAHRINHAGTFCAQARRQGRWCIQAAAEIGVDEVQANGLVLHANLLRAGFCRGVVHILKHFGAAMGTELDTFGHLHSP